MIRHWRSGTHLRVLLIVGVVVFLPKLSGAGTYIFAGDRPVTISELFATIAMKAGVNPLPVRIPALPLQLLGSLTEAVCQPLGIEPPLYRRRVDFFTKDRWFDCSKARSQLGFKPRFDFETEVDRILTWYHDHGWLN